MAASLQLTEAFPLGILGALVSETAGASLLGAGGGTGRGEDWLDFESEYESVDGLKSEVLT